MTKRLLAIAFAIALAVPVARASEEGAEAWDELMLGNEFFRADPLFAAQRAATATGQAPKAIVLTCADSRLPPEHIFTRGLGEVFTVRLAGNYPAPGTIGSIEYAIEHLGSKLVVVLGHRSCGAVKAAVGAVTDPEHNELPAGSDLAWLVKQIEPAVEAGKANQKPNESLLDAAIEANADIAAHLLLEKSEIVKKAVLSHEVKLVVAIYDLATGKVSLQPFHP